MGIAKVRYKKIGDLYMITGMEGFLSYPDLQKKYGIYVTDEYRGNKGVSMVLSSLDDVKVTIVISGGTCDKRIKVGDQYYRSEFSSIIDQMKQAGKRLTEIIKKHKEDSASVEKIIEI